MYLLLFGNELRSTLNFHYLNKTKDWFIPDKGIYKYYNYEVGHGARII